MGVVSIGHPMIEMGEIGRVFRFLRETSINLHFEELKVMKLVDAWPWICRVGSQTDSWKEERGYVCVLKLGNGSDFTEDGEQGYRLEIIRIRICMLARL